MQAAAGELTSDSKLYIVNEEADLSERFVKQLHLDTSQDVNNTAITCLCNGACMVHTVLLQEEYQGVV